MGCWERMMHEGTMCRGRPSPAANCLIVTDVDSCGPIVCLWWIGRAAAMTRRRWWRSTDTRR
jgi:hypothetical protein